MSHAELLSWSFQLVFDVCVVVLGWLVWLVLRR